MTSHDANPFLRAEAESLAVSLQCSLMSPQEKSGEETSPQSVEEDKMALCVQRSGHLFDSCRVVGIESDSSLEQLQRFRDLTFLSFDQTCSQQHMWRGKILHDV